jgi:RNA polymerase sigma-70 factor (ECF subfamily)
LDALHRFAFHLTLSRDEADDLVQETYLRAFRGRETFHPHEHGARPWLFKILHNEHRSRRMRAGRAPQADDGLDGHAAAAPDFRTAELDWDEVDERLKAAVEDLPEHLRLVLLLWAVDGMKYKEIAEVAGVPIGTVMSRLYRARASMCEQVADLGRELRLVSDRIVTGSDNG